MLVYLNLGFICVGLEVEDGIITEAPPALQWTIGKDAEYVKRYYGNRGKLIDWMEMS